MTRGASSAQTSSTRLSRRAIVATGAKLAYAAPLVAASLRLSELGAHALGSSCIGFPLDPTLPWVFDPNVVPPGAPDSFPGYPGCCTCGPIPAGATYYPTANFCCPAGYSPHATFELLCADGVGGMTSATLPLMCIPITETGVSNPV